MSKRKIMFVVCLVWFIIWIPLGGFWGWNPLRWLQRRLVGAGVVTIEEVRTAFPFHFASLPTSAIGQHTIQIEEEDPEAAPEFEPYDWAWRELRCRWTIALLFVMASGFFVTWFLGRIIRGQSDWSG